LRDHIATYHHCVPAVLYGKYQANLQQYADLYTEQRDLAIPKKKFQFVRKARKETVGTPTTAEPIESKKVAVVSGQGNHLLIKDLFNEPRIVKTLEEYRDKENVIMENLESCTVVLPFAVKCLYVKNVKNCKIYAAAVSGASFINEACESSIFLQSHQIRIHNSLKVTFYLTAKSEPIIEHCCELLFGPYVDASGLPALKYEGWEADGEKADLTTRKNLFDKVVDFNWLK
jgi:hypothetical protein